MNNKYARSLLAGLLTILLTSSVWSTAPAVHAQSLQYWSDPVNLSNSGSSTDPRMVIDSDGVIHVIWVDAIDGYMYTKSVTGIVQAAGEAERVQSSVSGLQLGTPTAFGTPTGDGVKWTKPQKADFPFSVTGDSRPDFFAGAKGLIYIVWRDKNNSLHVGLTQSRYLGSSSYWGAVSVIARSKISKSKEVVAYVAAYDAVVDSQGGLQLSYVMVGDSASSPAGVYYTRVSPGEISGTVNIYSSEYFRSLDSTSAHVRIAATKKADTDNIYIAWDDRPQKRIFMAKSLDGGKNWGEVSQITGPEAVTGLSIPFNIEIGVMNDKVLLTWQNGVPGGQCTNYSESSMDGGQQFRQPMKVSGPFALCTQPSEFVLQNQDLSVASFNVQDEISLVAWNGSGWSEPQPQDDIATFTNPVTLDSVIFSCQNPAVRDTTLYVVGCDKGNGGDIWFSSRSLGTLDDWFPPSSVWSAPVEATTIDQNISALSSVASGNNTIDAFWIQTPFLEGDKGTATVQYAQWNGADWSRPVPIVPQSDRSPVQLNVRADSLGRLLLVWVDGKTGDMFFSWANAERAKNPGEWQSPQYIASNSKANSSPDTLADASGKIIVAYAVPINEHRGIYFVESADGGISWTQPFQVFDAASAGWEVVDQPNITLTGDGRLHVLFRRYSLHSEQRQSVGLYYSQSADGGVTWSDPEAVSEDPVFWSQIIGYDRLIVHRLWQQYVRSALVTFHQLSRDGGLTWGQPAVVSSSGVMPGLAALTIDRAGNLDFVQLDSTDNLFILDHRWDGSGWIYQTPKKLYLKDRSVPSSITANTTSKGNLLVSVSLDYPFLTDEKKNDILSLGKLVSLPKAVQTAYPAVLPAAKATAMMIKGTPDALQPSATDSPPAGLNDSPPFLYGTKNLIGFVLLGGIVLLLVRIFRPVSGKQKNQNKTPR
jgi:hypothetical protein